MSRRSVRTANPAGYRGDIRRIERLLAFSMKALDLKSPVSLALVDDAAIRDLNKRYKGSMDTTDVLAFELATDGLSDPDPELGEIIVCVDTAREQAKDARITFAREVELLSLHGLLHLFGMDDAKPADRAAMVRKAEDLLSEFDGRESPRKRRPGRI